MNDLHLSDEAQADLAGIKSYIAKDLENPSAALSTVRNITKDIRRLREHSMIDAWHSSIADVECVLYGRRDCPRALFGEARDEETTE